MTEAFPGWLIPEGSSIAAFRTASDGGCLRCRIIIQCWVKLGTNARFMHSAHGTQLQRAIVEDTSMIQRWELFHLADRKGLTPPGIVRLKAYKVMPSGDTSSNEAFQWAMRRLQACNQSHKCYRLDSLFKPSRVVDVSSFKETQDVVLIDGSSMRDSRYVALSHCWGSFYSSL